MTLSLGGTTRTRSRTHDVTRSAQSFLDGAVTSESSFTFRTGEFTRDENHSTNRRLVKSPRFRELYGFADVGGPFFNEKISYWDDGREYTASSGGYAFRGCQIPKGVTLTTRTTGTNVFWNPVITASSDNELDVFGTTAISRCSPTNPHADAFTLIGELYRDGLPSAVGVKTLRDKDIGSEFLNYQFGISPLISDLKKLHKSLTESEKILKQYLRDSGRMVRRRYEQPADITTSATTDVGSGFICKPAALTPCYDGSRSGATIVTTTTIRSRKWFSGAFTYHAQLPEGTVNGMKQQARELNQLFGVLPTPEALWNLTPWSWAIDWIYNYGDILSNLSMMQSDGLVLNYGYVMEHKFITREYHSYGYAFKGGGPVNSVQRFTSEVKSRRKATPFGFGLKLESFSNRQWAILAALGLSKGRAVAF